MERIYNGIRGKKTVFILMLGICPALAVTTSAINGLGMGAAAMAVLILSNLVMSLLYRSIPEQARTAAYLIIAAGLVTVVQLLIQAYIPFLYDALGSYLPLIIVTCLILSRAENFDAKNSPMRSLIGSIGMGLGFTLVLTLIGFVRELFGAGTAFGVQIMPAFYPPIGILVKAPGAFLVFALLLAILYGANIRSGAGKKDPGCEAEKEENA